jgi:hypothetical protein
MYKILKRFYNLLYIYILNIKNSYARASQKVVATATTAGLSAFTTKVGISIFIGITGFFCYRFFEFHIFNIQFLSFLIPAIISALITIYVLDNFKYSDNIVVKYLQIVVKYLLYLLFIILFLLFLGYYFD